MWPIHLFSLYLPTFLGCDANQLNPLHGVVANGAKWKVLRSFLTYAIAVPNGVASPLRMKHGSGLTLGIPSQTISD
jgi:hypothetical protein